MTTSPSEMVDRAIALERAGRRSDAVVFWATAQICQRLDALIEEVKRCS